MITAPCLGAAARGIEVASAFAKSRGQFGGVIKQNPAIQRMLADTATEVAADPALSHAVAGQDRDAGCSGRDGNGARGLMQGDVATP